MAAAHIFQIFYSEPTRAALEPGFIALDNLANQRPDWREYWPIRNYLLGRELVEEDFYGFFSPKFGQKTTLSARQVQEFVLADPQVDVVIFSPYYDQSAFYLNPFEQGDAHHPGLLQAAQDFVAAIGVDIRLADLVTDSRSTIFCNYFVARPGFWRAWLEINEKLFALIESGDSDLGRRLNARTAYGRDGVQLKVFVMERVATLLLATQSRWRSTGYSPYRLLLTGSPLSSGFQFELMLLDALKIAYLTRGHAEYKDAFLRLRGVIYDALAKDGRRATDMSSAR
ncbi:MAG TPA: hypothetical protein VNF69_10600 [Burkholderiales bacterium]|nr:hypothetical protein [Burkholderiales bacterium]